MQNIKQIFFSPSHSRTMGLLTLLLLVAAIPLTVYLSQQSQNIQQEARVDMNCRDLKPSETDPPSGGLNDQDYVWKADCGGSCNDFANHSDCQKNTSQGEINPDTSRWCYGFKDTNNCLKLTYIKEGSGPNNPNPPPSSGNVCRNNPQTPPSGYLWKADCNRKCDSPCPKNTFDPSNVNPDTSAQCYGFGDGSSSQSRCMMLVRTNCQKAGDSGCGSGPNNPPPGGPQCDPDGQLDNNNTCNPACCNKDSQCPSGQACTTSNGFCKSGKSCAASSAPTCDPDGQLDNNNTCNPACCNKDSQCGSGQICNTGNGFCKSGTSCAVGTRPPDSPNNPAPDLIGKQCTKRNNCGTTTGKYTDNAGTCSAADPACPKSPTGPACDDNMYPKTKDDENETCWDNYACIDGIKTKLVTECEPKDHPTTCISDIPSTFVCPDGLNLVATVDCNGKYTRIDGKCPPLRECDSSFDEIQRRTCVNGRTQIIEFKCVAGKETVTVTQEC